MGGDEKMNYRSKKIFSCPNKTNYQTQTRPIALGWSLSCKKKSKEVKKGSCNKFDTFSAIILGFDEVSFHMARKRNAT